MYTAALDVVYAYMHHPQSLSDETR